MSYGGSGPPLLPSLPVIVNDLVAAWMLLVFLLQQNYGFWLIFGCSDLSSYPSWSIKVFFCQCLQLFSQTMQEEDGSFTSIEISLNWFPSSGFVLLEGLSCSLAIWWLWKSVGTELQDQAMLNPEEFLSELLMLLWCQHMTLLIHTRASCQLHPPKHRHPFVNSQSGWNINCQYNGKI